MNSARNGWPWLLRCACVAAALQTGIGCHSLLGGEDTPPNPTPTQVAPGPSPPEQFHVFLIHGLDPVDLANMNGMMERIKELGFVNTSLVQFYQAGQVEDDIRKLHHD